MKGCAALLVAVLAGGLALAPEAVAVTNEPAALVVFPEVINDTTGTETILTIENLGSTSVSLLFVFVSGDTCSSCDFTLSLGPNDSEMLVASRSGANTNFRAADTGITRACPAANGYAVAVAKDPATGAVLTDNVLGGSSVVVNYTRGETSSTAAIPVAGVGAGQCRGCLALDDQEFTKLPRIVASTFLAPDYSPGVDATLTLFTLGFQTGQVPFTDCQVTGSDEDGNVFSSSFQFGCWSRIRLADIDPEFAYPFLGTDGTPDQQGFVQLDCSVDDANGAVHGVLSQVAPAGARLRRPSGPTLPSASSWSRVLVESLTHGDSVEFCAQAFAFPDADGDGVGNGCDPCADDPLDDSDNDGVCGNVDNCPLHSNSGQANADADSYGDACDLCPALNSANNRDADRDGVGDACDADTDGDGVANAADPDDDNDGVPDSDGDGLTDPCNSGNRFGCDDNCPFDRNANQGDFDGDGVGDVCDNNDSIVGGGRAAKTSGGPGLLGGPLAYAFSWERELGATSYNVYHGLLSSLTGVSYGTCYRNRIAATFTSLTDAPATGTGFFYLVSARFNDFEGILGEQSNGSVRPNGSPCP